MFPIIIRIDDICPTMDEKSFNKYLNLLKQYDVKPLLGIIPDCKDSSISHPYIKNFWSKMCKLKNDGYPIAMHGVHHVYTQKKKGIICSRPLSEFAGLSYEKQVKVLDYGLKTLQEKGLETDVFFAPGHSYDNTTLKALSYLGFKIVSDGRSLFPYRRYGIICVPVNGPYKIHFGRGILTVALHPSDEEEKDYYDLEVFLKKNHKRIIPFEKAVNLKCHPYIVCRFEEKINMAINRIVLKLITTFKK